jgi:hypothetical protein
MGKSKFESMVARGKENSILYNERQRQNERTRISQLKDNFKLVKKDMELELKDYILDKGHSEEDVKLMIKNNRSYINKILLCNYEFPYSCSLEFLYLNIK